MEFPTVWFRDNYIFKADSVIDWLFLAPNDGHYFKTGKWWISSPEEGILSIQFEPDQEGSSHFQILELNDSTLKLQSLTLYER